MATTEAEIGDPCPVCIELGASKPNPSNVSCEYCGHVHCDECMHEVCIDEARHVLQEHIDDAFENTYFGGGW